MVTGHLKGHDDKCELPMKNKKKVTNNFVFFYFEIHNVLLQQK